MSSPTSQPDGLPASSRRSLGIAALGCTGAIWAKQAVSASQLSQGDQPLAFDITASGATGDGLTDDVAVIQRFLDELASVHSGAVVRLPPGRFYLLDSAPLIIPRGMVIEGAYNGFGANLNRGFEAGGGFYVNPANSTVILSAAASLRNCKVYRKGLVANASTDEVADAVATWADEGFYLQTTARCPDGATLEFASTAGVARGMPISGPGISPGTVVRALVEHTSVTLSKSVFSEVASGAFIRFGASIGITIPTNESGVVLENLCVIGFRTGIQCQSGQFWATAIEADCITNLEGFNAGDTAHVRSWHCIQWYGAATGNAPRPGDAIFYHDAPITWHTDDIFIIGWHTGFRLVAAQGAQIVDCNVECFLNDVGSKAYFLDRTSDTTLHGCHAEGASTGFHVRDTGYFVLRNCGSANSSTSDPTAHFLVEGPSVDCRGAIIAPLTNGGAKGMVPFLLRAGIAGMKLSDPVILHAQANPAIQIHPSVAFNIGRINVYDFDAGLGSSRIAQSYLKEKLYVRGLGTETTDGSPTSPLAIDLYDGLSDGRPIVTFIRNGRELGSVQCTDTDLHLDSTGSQHIGHLNGNVFIPAQLNLGQAVVNTSVNYVSVSNGDTIHAAALWAEYLIDGNDALSALRMLLPPNVVDGTLFKVRFNVDVASLAVETQDGSSVGRYPASISAGSSIEWIYQAKLSKWFAG